MGMSASQARFLSITARLSDNELKQQSLAYSKQRLSEKSSNANDTYLDALNKTKYQILTGYNGSEATYSDISYNQITGCNTVACGKQYLVKDNSGKVLVSSAVAAAFEKGNGDFNKFLEALGYTQSDIDVNTLGAEDDIHDAWDEYLVSVGQSIDNTEDGKHILSFGYSSNGYPTYNTAHTTEVDGSTINLYKDSNGYYKDNYKIQARQDSDGNIYCAYQTNAQKGTDEWNKLEGVSYNTETKKFTYDGFVDDSGNPIEYDALYVDGVDENNAMIFENSINRLTFNGTNYTSETGNTYDITGQEDVMNFEGTTTAQRELYDYAVAITEAYYNSNSNASTLNNDTQMVNYYKNIFNEMRSCGYTTTEEAFNVSPTQASTDLKDPEWFVNQLKAGKLTLSYYSTSDKAFVGTTLDDDESVTEKEDTSAITIAEQVYQSEMDEIESQDKQFDLQLTKLESEHNALQTEYESVQKVISKNVENSFKTFS
jgi:hypothetical protein